MSGPRRSSGGLCRASWVLLATIILLLLPAVAQAANVVITLSADAGPYREAEAGLRETLGEEGHSVSTVLLPALKSGEAARQLDGAATVVAIGTDAAAWLHSNLPPQVPLVYCMVGDAQAAGLTEDPRARGITTEIPLRAQLALLADTLPRARKIGTLYRSDTEDGRRMLARLRDALPAGWSLEATALDKFESTADAIEQLMSRHVDAIWTYPAASIFNNATARMLLLESLRHKVPVFGFSTPFVKAGALVGVGIDARTQGRDAATLVPEALSSRGGAASRPAPASPPRFAIAVNLIVAEQLGVDVPAAIVQAAGQVFRPGDGGGR